MQSQGLQDKHRRRIRKLRLSLLDACNFRCFYCMPLQAKFMHQERWLSVSQIMAITELLCDYGIEEIRVTGGEPLLRPQFREIIRNLSRLPLRRLGLTTNGYRLQEELGFLQDTQCHYINISLDSVDPQNFARITRSSHFANVIGAIRQAKQMDFHVKVNTVLMRGHNDHELQQLIQFAADEQVELRFLELMKIGQACRDQPDLFMSAGEAMAKIQRFSELRPIQVEQDSTSFDFWTDSGAHIGFIASESRPFCGNCSRWRLSADGFLRACLMSQEGVSLRGLSPTEIYPKLQELLPMKPTGRIERVEQDMNQIGG